MVQSQESGVSRARFIPAPENEDVLCVSANYVERILCDAIWIAKIMHWSLRDNRVVASFVGHKAEYHLGVRHG